jgi:hypothetical protein
VKPTYNFVGIAGRTYEHLRNYFSVFLETELHFNEKDLNNIVKNCEVFLLVLTPEYTESDQCVQELRWAIRNKKKVKYYDYL